MTTYTHSFTGYVPPARFDGLAWQTARIEESASQDGTFASVQTFTLSPLDTDPVHPLSRNFTLTQATLASGWYRIIFVDAALAEAPASTPVLSPAPTPGLTLAEMRTELRDRGFDYLDDARANHFLNVSYQEIMGAEDWPFLEAIETGNAPITITDLSSIESVIDSTQSTKLWPLDRRNITDDWTTDLSTVGTPSFYYVTQGNTVNVWPANTTDTISVRYWRDSVALTLDADTPLVPSQFQQGIIEGAVGYAYQDADEFDAAQAAFSHRDSFVENMRLSQLNQDRDMPDDFLVITDIDSPIYY